MVQLTIDVKNTHIQGEWLMSNSPIIFPVPRQWQGHSIFYVTLDKSAVISMLYAKARRWHREAMPLDEAIGRVKELVLNI